MIDADREVVRNYDISSETYSLSYSMPGASLFRGQFSFSGTDFEGELRIPLDISYSDSLAKLIFIYMMKVLMLLGVVKSIKLQGGNRYSR